jgi:anti-anti-sigma factor
MATSLSTGCIVSPALDGVSTTPWIEVSVIETTGELVVLIAGEAGVEQATALEVALLRVSARRAPLVTLDLSQLRFLSSLAIGALVTFRRGVVRAGGRVRLVPRLQESVRESLERTGVMVLFDLAGEIEAPGAVPRPPVQRSERGSERVRRDPKFRDLEKMHGVTWAELAGLEPRLAELLWQARAAGAGCHSWEEVPQAFAPFRHAVAEVVGFRSGHSEHPVLGSVGAYEVAFWRLRDAVAGLLPRPCVGLPHSGEVAATCPESRRTPTAQA